ncbi:MAG TPA: NUDIX domain-containing protein [Chloroflexota bacterium]|nr:NUDIX domain-containing protein [Chloroflexota bacterium]
MDTGSESFQRPATVDTVEMVIDTVPEEAREWPVHCYHAAGGLVVHHGRVLLLRRGKEVRVPKGHLEPEETVAECALRETREETGLVSPHIVAPLGTIENRFAHKGQQYVRYETWFLMETDDPTPHDPEPQWTPVWHRLKEAEAALSFEAERQAFRWARAAVVSSKPG